MKAYTLTTKVALHIHANDNYRDQFGTRRSIGEEWLVTSEDTESYIPDVTEVRGGKGGVGEEREGREGEWGRERRGREER